MTTKATAITTVTAAKSTQYYNLELIIKGTVTLDGQHMSLQSLADYTMYKVTQALDRSNSSHKTVEARQNNCDTTVALMHSTGLFMPKKLGNSSELAVVITAIIQSVAKSDTTVTPEQRASAIEKLEKTNNATPAKRKAYLSVLLDGEGGYELVQEILKALKLVVPKSKTPYNPDTEKGETRKDCVRKFLNNL